VPGLYVFIVPPSMDALHARLVSRGANSAAEIESRMAIARKELEARDLYDHVIVNEKLDEAIRTVEGLVGL
jgi:guanylate kinase